MIVNLAVWKHLNDVSSEQFITDNNLVLLDSGSNEVVRSYNGWEWQHILDKKPHTKRIRVGLALNQSMEAGITIGGELMRAPPKYGPQNLPKSSWICPNTRFRTELGMDFFWPARGPVIDGGKLEEPVVGIEINGLPYCAWDQFQAIRWALQQSHQMGRKPAEIYCGVHGNEVAAQKRNGGENTTPNTQRVRSDNRGRRRTAENTIPSTTRAQSDNGERRRARESGRNKP